MSQVDCLFCKIVAGQIPAQLIHQTDTTIAFNDIAPQAPTHILVIPKAHVASVAEVQDPAIYAEVLTAVRDIAKAQGIEQYRIASNTGAEAGQSVFHWHVHLLAGRAFAWPPG